MSHSVSNRSEVAFGPKTAPLAELYVGPAPYKQAYAIVPRPRGAMRLLLAFSVVLLVALNVLTVVDEEIHAMFYGAIKSALEKVGSHRVASNLLKSSPTEMRAASIVNATRRIETEKFALAVANKSLETQRVALVMLNKAAEARNLEMTNVAALRSYAVRTASKRIATRSISNAVRNLGSVAAESVPVVGTVVIVGVTIMDLADACQNMKDLNELNAIFDLQHEDSATVCGFKIP